MVVNPFWFGVLMTIVGFIVIVIVVAIVNAAKADDYSERMTPQEYKQMMEELSGKKFRITEQNGYLVGEMIEDDEDDETD